MIQFKKAGDGAHQDGANGTPAAVARRDVQCGRVIFLHRSYAVERAVQASRGYSSATPTTVRRPFPEFSIARHRRARRSAGRLPAPTRASVGSGNPPAAAV